MWYINPWQGNTLRAISLYVFQPKPNGTAWESRKGHPMNCPSDTVWDPNRAQKQRQQQRQATASTLAVLLFCVGWFKLWVPTLLFGTLPRDNCNVPKATPGQIHLEWGVAGLPLNGLRSGFTGKSSLFFSNTPNHHKDCMVSHVMLINEHGFKPKPWVIHMNES